MALKSAVAASLAKKGELVVGEHMRIKESDTEEQRRSKLEKIRKIKKKNVRKQKDQETNIKKNQWKDFQKKGRTKRKRKHKSIFATTDNGRVGFTGSGKGVTDYKVPVLTATKKRRLNNNEAMVTKQEEA